MIRGVELLVEPSYY